LRPAKLNITLRNTVIIIIKEVARFEVFASVKVQVAVFWEAAPCVSEDPCCLSMELQRTSYLITTRREIPEHDLNAGKFLSIHDFIDVVSRVPVISTSIH
jgi:hypothetical protein